ncbi:MAG: glycoside hydrolase family 5 protein [Ruminococcaceae bacterium]|nr:glycoside hydrolase family 5 protein [Oscillospiraceae bacterium]
MKLGTNTRKASVLIVAILLICMFPVNVFAAPSGKAKGNCWGSGGQLTVELSGCSGYKTITVTAEFSGTIKKASGWGFDSYKISGKRVIATVSSSGPNKWAFNGSVGIQVDGSNVKSAKLISVKGDGEEGSVSGNNGNTNASNEGNGGPTKAPARNVKGEKGDDWLTTKGSKIVDKNGTEVWLTGCNWFGYNTGTNLFDGVWNCNLKEALRSIADHGFNLLRVPMSSELILQWKNGQYPKANYNNAYNEELNKMNSLEIFDYVLSLCEQNGMKVMIDIHSVKTDAAGHNYPVWFNGNITEADFIESLRWMAARYKDNDTIIAFDLKNEPHGKPSESPRAIWNDSDDPNNWKKVAEKTGKTILKENPNVLIVIEGIECYPKDIKANNFTSTDQKDYHTTWWGGNLMGVKDYPIDLGSKEFNKQIVYSPHDYGPIVYKQPWFESAFTYESLKKDAWDPYWLFIADRDIAPVLIGEWGGFMQGDNLTWMKYIRQLIDEKKLNHIFWCFNANSGDTGGLVKDDFKTWDEEKYNLVKEVLWQNGSGRFVGLDHKVPLGANGISLSDFSGKIVRIESETTTSQKQTESEPASSLEETTALQTDAETMPAPAGSEKTPSNVRRIVLAVIIITVSLGVCVLAVVAGTRAASKNASKTADDKEDSLTGGDSADKENADD